MTGAKSLCIINASTDLTNILISQKDQHLDRFARRDDGQWLYSSRSGEGAMFNLAAVDLECPLAQLYQGLDWAE